MGFILPLGCSRAGAQKEELPYIIEEIGGWKVYLVLPRGKSPEKGWPVVVLLHGRGQTAGAWFGEGLLSRGDQKLFPPLALKSGMVVIAPEAREPFGKGIRQWDFFHRNLQNSPDLTFFRDLFQWMEKNTKITFDISRVHGVGISSGGFMASRLALAFPDKWASLIVIAAGNADSFPQIPSFPLDSKALGSEISTQHPPTLIIHGAGDRIVPFVYGERYFQDLKQAGIKTEMLVIPEGGHQWPTQFHENMIKWLSSNQKSSLPGVENKDKFNLDETSDGKNITLETGENFSLSLKGVPTAGYVWKITEIDETMLKKLDQGEETLTKPGLVGGAARFSWRFQALGKGITRLTLKHYRPWEGPEKASKTFSLEVQIQ